MIEYQEKCAFIIIDDYLINNIGVHTPLLLCIHFCDTCWIITLGFKIWPFATERIENYGVSDAAYRPKLRRLRLRWWWFLSIEEREIDMQLRWPRVAIPWIIWFPNRSSERIAFSLFVEKHSVYQSALFCAISLAKSFRDTWLSKWDVEGSRRSCKHQLCLHQTTTIIKDITIFSLFMIASVKGASWLSANQNEPGEKMLNSINLNLDRGTGSLDKY